MKFFPKIIKAICAHIEMGVTQRDAAALEDVAEDTFYTWMKKPEFSEPIKKARLLCKARNVKLISKAAITRWQAAAWSLERTYPEDYALRARLEHTGKGGGPIRTSKTFDFRKVDDETLERIAFGAKERPKAK